MLKRHWSKQFQRASQFLGSLRIGASDVRVFKKAATRFLSYWEIVRPGRASRKFRLTVLAVEAMLSAQPLMALATALCVTFPSRTMSRLLPSVLPLPFKMILLFRWR